MVEFHDTERRFQGQTLNLLKQVVGLHGVTEDSTDADSLLFQLTAYLNHVSQELTRLMDSEKTTQCRAELRRDVDAVGKGGVQADMVAVVLTDSCPALIHGLTGSGSGLLLFRSLLPQRKQVVLSRVPIRLTLGYHVSQHTLLSGKLGLQRGNGFLLPGRRHLLRPGALLVHVVGSLQLQQSLLQPVHGLRLRKNLRIHLVKIPHEALAASTTERAT